MKLPAIFITFLFSVLCVMGADKNKLEVKINYAYKLGTSGRVALDSFKYKYSGKWQFRYDTREQLEITRTLESYKTIDLRRTEINKFKVLLSKMLKFADAVHQNKITGVEKRFEDRSLWTLYMSRAPAVDIAETGDPEDKGDIIFWISGEAFFYYEIEELAKIIDEKTAEVFKKYDLLKALND